MSEWFEEWFRSDLYLKLYSHRDSAEAEQCVDLILSSTGVGPGAALLDLACGPGRHAVALAERGATVTAVDLSPTLLNYAESEAAAAGVSIRFCRSDMREIAFEGEFDLAVQLFTSFGYFYEHEDDLTVLNRVHAALRKDGWYALDLINEQHLQQTLIPRSEKSIDGIQVNERRTITDDRVEKHIGITRPDGGTIEFVESVRLFSPDEIEVMLRETGFRPEFWFGDYTGSSYNRETSERMIVISKRGQ